MITRLKNTLGCENFVKNFEESFFRKWPFFEQLMCIFIRGTGKLTPTGNLTPRKLPPRNLHHEKQPQGNYALELLKNKNPRKYLPLGNYRKSRGKYLPQKCDPLKNCPL